MAKGCANCGTLHDGLAECPGMIPVMAPERRGASLRVRTEHGAEVVRVLIAPSSEGWRARIMSEPNVLWTVPGGRTTLKFWGDTPQEAEKQAIAFVEEHTMLRRSVARAAAAAGATARADPAAHPQRDAGSKNRKRARFPVRFGVERASSLGTTANLSPEGMFIVSARPLEVGTPIRIHVETKGTTLPIRGLVMWSRSRPEPGRPAGMGVRLLSPPPGYTGLIASLP